MVQNAGLGVGALLRQRREELGQDIEAVAGQLRIRPIYITAIEDGRLQDLPGTAYAVGFVRTYADFLGFDGNSVVANYRDELAQRSRTEPVTWRMEERESHFPGGKLLIACMVLAGLGYGAWYYLSNTPSGVGLIEAVPEYLKKGNNTANSGSKTEETAKPAETAALQSGTPEAKPSTDGAAPAATAGTATGESSTPVPGSQSTSTTGTPSTGAAATSTAPAAPAADGAMTGAPAGQAAAGGGQTTGGQAPQTMAPAGVGQAGNTATSAPVTEGTAMPAATANQPAATQPAGAAQQQSAAAPQAASSAAQTSAANQTEGSEAAPEVAAAAAASTTRISIRAKLESWVQILDKDGKPILSRVLRAGETYAVPDEKGLIMSTGNAGGIEMVLDGKPLQSLGSVGLVRRNITLDPEKLASGAAFLKTPAPVAPASNGGGANTGD